MHKILMINEENVALGDENNNLVTVPRTAVSYENPAVGDSVDLFQNDSVSIVVKAENDNKNSSKRSESAVAQTELASAQNEATKEPAPSNVTVNVQQTSAYVAQEKRINKHVFAWVGGKYWRRSFYARTGWSWNTQNYHRWWIGNLDPCGLDYCFNEGIRKCFQR